METKSANALRAGMCLATVLVALSGCGLILGIEDATVGSVSEGGGGEAGAAPSTSSSGGGGAGGVGGGGGAGGGEPSSVCGNGELEGDEACDDGNLDDNDACRNTCVSAVCGDGVVWTGTEDCDDGNDSNDDACVAGCIASRCGDGYVRDGVEGCDDGNTIDNDACRNNCSLPTCGDGLVQQGEACDDANAIDTDDCLSTCQLPTCGDGYVKVGSTEQCDDGNTDDTDDCLSTCTVAFCGDGFVKAGSDEHCDDGNDLKGDGCHQCQAVVQIAVHMHHSCALMTDGAVKCWGRNNHGQLGQGHADDMGDAPGEIAALAPIALGAPAISVATGHLHSCAILQGGAVKCWGNNTYGQLGLADPNGTTSFGASPTDMANLPPVTGLPAAATQLSLGYYRSCAKLTNGQVYCWGFNGSGAVGVGTGKVSAPGTAFYRTPQLVDLGAEPAEEIATFTRHTCARMQSGDVKCWGENYLGALGIGMPTGHDIGDEPGEMGAALATSYENATHVTAGEFTTCVISGGELRCWGGGASGRLGTQATLDIGDAPGEVEALLSVDLDGTPIQASLGRVHGCAVLDDGRVRCWGAGAAGATGHGSTADKGHAPGTMGTALPATTLSAPFDPALQVGTGEYYSCALLQSRRVKCWGYGLYGRHGGGTTNDLGDTSSEMGNALQALPLP